MYCIETESSVSSQRKCAYFHLGEFLCGEFKCELHSGLYSSHNTVVTLISVLTVLYVRHLYIKAMKHRKVRKYIVLLPATMEVNRLL